MALLFTFGLHATDVKEISLDDLKKLQVLNSENSNAGLETDKDKILYFWATWCPDCKEKLTSVFQKEEIFNKFDVYLVATDKDIKKIEHFQNKNNLKKRVVTDPDKQLQKLLKVFSVPTFIRLKKDSNKFVIQAQQSGGDIESLLK